MADPAHSTVATARATHAILRTLRRLAAGARTPVASAVASAVRRAHPGGTGQASTTSAGAVLHRGTARTGALLSRGTTRTSALASRGARRVGAGLRRTAVGTAALDGLAGWWRVGSARLRVAGRAVGDLISVFAALALLLGGPAGNRLRTRRTPLARHAGHARHARASHPIGTPGLVAAGVLLAGLIGGVAVAATTGPTVPAHSVLADSLGSRQLAADRANRDTRPVPATPGAGTGASATAGPAAATPDWVNPMPGVPLTSCFGPRWGTMHQGIDFAGAAGTPILAAAAGTIFAAGWTYSGYGISIMIDHGNGLYSHYAHAEEALVTVGQHVVAGQPIALEGTTGDSTGPHLHFEIHEGLWNQVDPAPFLRSHGVAVAC